MDTHITKSLIESDKNSFVTNSINFLDMSLKQ